MERTTNCKKLKHSNKSGSTGDTKVCNAVPSDGDENKLLCTFPAEIWEIILRKIKSPSDLQHLSNSSLYFRNYFLSQRTLFLFPSVWNVIQARGSDYQVNGRTQILKYRQVCSSWNAVVESVKPSNFGNQVFESFDDFSRFWNYFRPTDKLTFVLDKAIDFNLPTTSLVEPERYFLGFNQFINEFGHLIKYCTITGSSSNIAKMLNRSNRLGGFKALKLKATDCSEKVEKTDIASIAQLENLEFLFSNGLQASVFNQLLRVNQQKISYLDIENGTYQYIFYSAKLDLPNLRAVSLKIPSVKCFKKFVKYGAAWKVEMLELTIEKGICSTFEVLESIQKIWAKSLTSVSIDLSKTTNPESKSVNKYSSGFCLNMEKIKTLNLNLVSMPKLEFLLPVRETLEQLKISSSGKGREGQLILSGIEANSPKLIKYLIEELKDF